MPLTALKVERAKPTKDGKTSYLSDGNGLRLVIYASGSKAWELRYSIGNKRPTLKLGDYPELGLADARSKAEEYRARAKSNKDPRYFSGTRAEAIEKNKFKSWAQRYYDECEKEGQSETKLGKLQLAIKRANPFLGELQINEITPEDCLALVESLIKEADKAGTKRAGAMASADQVSLIFHFAEAKAACNYDPMGRVKRSIKPAPTKSAPKIKDHRILVEVIRRFRGLFSRQAAIMLLLLLHTFLRKGELRKALWEHIDFEKVYWYVPANNTKMDRPHIVPLTQEVIDLLNYQRQLFHKGENPTGVIFKPQGKAQFVAHNRLNQTIDITCNISNDLMTPHSTRGIASTAIKGMRAKPDAPEYMARWYDDVIELQLNHLSKRGIKGVYDEGAYMDMRREILTFWSGHLAKLGATAAALRETKYSRYQKYERLEPPTVHEEVYEVAV